MSNDKAPDLLSEWILEKVSAGTYDPSGDGRAPGKLYYRKNILDMSQTPEQVASRYAELQGFSMQMKLYGYHNRALSVLVGVYGLASVQNLIDSYTA